MKKPTQKKKKKGTRKKTQTAPKTRVTPVSEENAAPVAKESKKKSYPVSIKKEPEKRGREKTSIFKFVNIAGQFLRESKIELKKVKWPTRKELLAATAMVIFLVVVVAFFLGLVDFGLIKIIKNVVG
jgi:preprotein translocase subunit SecE